MDLASEKIINIDRLIEKSSLINTPEKQYGNEQLKKCREYLGEESRESGWWAGMPFIDRMALINAAGVGGNYQRRRTVAQMEWKVLSQDWRRGILVSVRRMCAWAKQKNI